MEKKGFILNISLPSLIMMLLSVSVQSQTVLPSVELKGIDNSKYILSEIAENNLPTVVIFWATWCKPCIDELDNISDYYDEWKTGSEFNLLAVCIDDTRSSSAVRSFVLGRQWPFTVLIDNNQEVKRAMNVTDIPHYLIFGKNKKLISRHSGYLPGDEDLLFEKIQIINYEKQDTDSSYNN